MLIYYISFGYGPIPIHSLCYKAIWHTLYKGSDQIFEKMAEDIPAKFLLNTGVSSVKRDKNGVLITTESGKTARYDEIVIATEADTALSILSDATWEEKLLLGDIIYDPVSVIVHTDSVVMPKDRAMWASFNYIARGNQGPFQDFYYSYYLPKIQPWVDFDVFVSFNMPEGLIKLETIIAAMK